jgi:hypothetical protein
MISDDASFPLLCWPLVTSVLNRGCSNSRSIGNFDPFGIGLRLDTLY